MGTVLLFGFVPKGFIPSDDTGQISGITEAAQGTSFEAMVTHRQMLAAIVARDPNVQEFISAVGQGGGVSGSNHGALGVAVVGGLAFSQLITLYITPVVYTYMDDFQHWLASRRVRGALTSAPEPALSGD